MHKQLAALLFATECLLLDHVVGSVFATLAAQMFLANWSGDIHYGWNVLCLPYPSLVVICRFGYAVLNSSTLILILFSQVTHLEIVIHATSVSLSPPTLRRLEGRRKKWEESLAILQSHLALGIIKLLPRHATCSGWDGLIPIQNPGHVKWTCSCVIDNIPTGSLQHVEHYAGLYERCRIKQHMDLTSNSLSSRRKVNMCKNMLIKGPRLSKPQSTPHTCHQFPQCHPCKLYKAAPFMSDTV